MSNQVEGYLSIGQVLRPQGLKGQVKIRPDTDDPNRFSALHQVNVLLSDGKMTSLPIRGISIRGNGVVANIDTDSTVEQAELRRGQFLYVPRGEAVSLGEHENFITDIIGCALVDNKGKHYGVVREVLQPGANDVYQIETGAGMMLVPALRHVILAVNVAEKTIVADAERLMEVSVFED